MRSKLVTDQAIREDVKFIPQKNCWTCGEDQLVPVHQACFDLTEYSAQDPGLAAYTGHRFWLQRCRSCGFAQPEALPALPNFFDRLYDQRWADAWMEQEFNSRCKDAIFHTILHQLAKRVPRSERTLLDIGAHVGRFLDRARQSGWRAEGIELNPQTAAFAARKTQLPVHQVNAQSLVLEEKQYAAVTLIDVLEHIPDPVKTLITIRKLLSAGGWVAVKVPCGRNQLRKEHVRALFCKRHRISVADNLVHVSHFSPTSLRRALRTAGFSRVFLTVGAPELGISESGAVRANLSNLFRLGVYRLGRFLPWGVHSPLALNLQAYAQNPSAGRFALP
jgi:2-polyprenyl-3-methyl-5-hydroxy-6-metoxy-1,4-benzoquinol methylase